MQFDEFDVAPVQRLGRGRPRVAAGVRQQFESAMPPVPAEDADLPHAVDACQRLANTGRRGGGLDLDLSRSKDIEPVVSGMELVDSGLYVAPRQSSAGRTLIVKAVGGSITVRYSRFDFS